MKLSIIFLSFVLVVSFAWGGDAHAQYTYNFKYEGVQALTLDDATAQKGYTIEAFDGQFRFGITPNVLTQGGAFEFKEVIPLENSGMEIPSGYTLVSKIIEFDIKNKSVYDPKKPFWLQMKYDSSLRFDKFLFYFDQGKGRWIQLPSTTDLEKGIVKAAFHLPYAKLAVFDTETMMFGKASWYAYKQCMCAASPDYPRGTQLLVTNLNADESILITVNDWGPERDIFPDRVIDLDVVAFEKFGSRRIGVLQNIHVMPYVATDFSEDEQIALRAGEVVALTEDRKTYIMGTKKESIQTQDEIVLQENIQEDVHEDEGELLPDVLFLTEN